MHPYVEHICNTDGTQMYVLSRCEHHYFNRRIDDKILRLSLHTTDKKVAQERAANLYLLTNKCIRLFMDYSAIKRKVRVNVLEH